MVIIIMGEVESGRDRVAASVAESLGWDFLDIEKRCGAVGTSSSIIGTKGGSPMESLRAVLDSSIYEWRDVVLSCPVLTEKDQKHLRGNRSLVKFVHLKATDPSDSILRLNPSAEVRDSGPANAEELTAQHDKGVLILQGSLETVQIVNEVLKGAVLQRSCTDAA